MNNRAVAGRHKSGMEWWILTDVVVSNDQAHAIVPGHSAGCRCLNVLFMRVHHSSALASLFAGHVGKEECR